MARGKRTGERERERGGKKEERNRENGVAARCKTASFPSTVESIGQSELKSRSIFSGRTTPTSFPRRINSTSAAGKRRGGAAGGPPVGWSRSARRFIEFPPSFKSEGKRVHRAIYPRTRMRPLSSVRMRRERVRRVRARERKASRYE